MRRSASEVLRNLEMRVARLERQAASDFEYKTIMTGGSKMYFSFVNEQGGVKNVSYKEWLKSNLPDQSSASSQDTLKTALLTVARGKIQFNKLIEVNSLRGDFFKTMDWLDKNGVKVPSRGIKVY